MSDIIRLFVTAFPKMMAEVDCCKMTVVKPKVFPTSDLVSNNFLFSYITCPLSPVVLMLHIKLDTKAIS